MNVEVLTLSRMATRVMEEIGEIIHTRLSKVGKSMLIYDILSKEKNNLKFLGKSDKNIDIVGNMLTEFKKHSINVENLNSFDFSDEYIKLKIKDISIIYEKYNQKINGKFIDENDSMDILVKLLPYSKMFNDSIIYIDDFMGFTKQEYLVFENLLIKCKEINVAICSNELERFTEKENDIFYFNKIYARKLLQIAENNGAEVIRTYLSNIHRFKNDELKFLEENIYEINPKKYIYGAESINLFLANNPYSEMEYVAKKVINLIRNEGFKYNEIGIVTQNIDEYIEIAKAVFDKYEIPLFIDSKKDLNQNILIKYIIAMLDIYSKNWSYDAVMNFLKIGLNEFSSEEIYELENYCKKWGIKSSKWYNREFNYEPINELQTRMEKLRKAIIAPILKFKNDVSDNRTVYEITKHLYNYLIDNKINEFLDAKIKKYNSIEISDEYNTSFKVLVNIFDELVLLFGDEKISFEKYKELVQVGIKSSELGKLPATQDQVVLGDIDRSRSNNIKALFVVGINDGVFPANSREEGYLNDSDRQLLKDNGFEIAKDSTELLYESQFNIYRTLTLPEEKLFLSYYSSNKEGKSVRPSILIKKIKRLYPSIKEESDIIQKQHEITTEEATFEEALNIYKEYLEGKEISDDWKEILSYFYKTRKDSFDVAMAGMKYTNLPEQINKNNIQKLYGNTLRTSVSRLEAYRQCPFSFHLTYGLKLKEKDELKMAVIDTGSFMHEVIDEFFKRLDENSININSISNEQIKTLVDEIIEELLQMSKYYTFSSTAKFKLLTRRLKKVVLKSMEYIVYSLKNSDFSILGHEVEFNNLSEFKPIQMSLFDNSSIEITGKIDRVDLGTIDGKQYVRVIDYKSSTKKMDLNKVVSGLQIQLITYLDALTEQKDYEASGVLYLGLIDNIVKSVKNISEDDIEREIRKAFKMQGYVLADVNVIKTMDKTLENSSTSDIIPVSFTKDGDIMSSRSSTLTKKEFQNLQKTVKKTIKEIGKQILEGRIDIKPYNYEKKTGCDFCKYKTICNFNTNIKGNEYDYIDKYTKDYILEQIAENK